MLPRVFCDGESDAEKTQSATPRRREEARKQGNVWQPRELAPAAALAVAAVMVTLAGPLLWQGLAGFLARTLGGRGARCPMTVCR